MSLDNSYYILRKFPVLALKHEKLIVLGFFNLSIFYN